MLRCRRRTRRCCYHVARGIAPNATVVGDVDLGKHVNIWYGAVLRGDHGKITLG
ncbi:MAG: hypothetical protein IIV71_01665, partial [Bacteroidaceae bacterium]|nr:hypothetical protein [Bacteroidaceae bacterium]